jgi:hypothetical protein
MAIIKGLRQSVVDLLWSGRWDEIVSTSASFLRSADCVTVARILGTFTRLAPQEPVLENYIARTVHFHDDGASIIVTYLESHKM